MFSRTLVWKSITAPPPPKTAHATRLGVRNVIKKTKTNSYSYEFINPNCKNKLYLSSLTIWVISCFWGGVSRKDKNKDLMGLNYETDPKC